MAAPVNNMNIQNTNYWAYGQGALTPAQKESLTQQQQSADTFELIDKGSDSTGMSFDARQSSQGLATVADQQSRNAIKLGSILEDFKGTMAALGVDGSVEDEVDVYLEAVTIQGQKDEPDVGYIRQTLKTSAKVLDQFITTALKQPSNVVSDWVDALLLQPIEYKVDGASNSQTTGTKTTGTKTTVAASVMSQPSNAQEDYGNTREQLKNLVLQGKQALSNNNAADAVHYFQTATQQLSSESPLTSGKVWQLAARAYEANSQPQQALQAYEQSEAYFDEANDKQRLISVLKQQANIYEGLGQLTEAADVYEAAIDTSRLAEDIFTQADLTNTMALIKWQQGDLQQAEALLNSVFPIAKQQDALLAADIASNLGELYEQRGSSEQAFHYYQQGFSFAQQAKDTETLSFLAQQLARLQ